MDPIEPTATGAPPAPSAKIEVDVIPMPGGRKPPTPQESASVKKWMRTIAAARKHDEEARKQYARDRRYARGDSAFEVDANLIGTYIDILESFLYARDPDVDVRPARSAEPPSLEAMRDAAEDHVDGLPDASIAQQQAQQAVLQDTGDPLKAAQAGQQAADALREHMIEQKFAELRKRFRRRQRDNKAFADTMEIVISRLWKDANLKPRATRWVRSSLTVALGVVKAYWDERTAPNPETQAQIHDLLAMMKRAAATRDELDELSGESADAKMAEYQQQLQALRDQAQVVVARGFVIELVPPEDFQVATGYAIADHCDAPWNSQRIPMLADDAKARFELSDALMKRATRYKARKPKTCINESPSQQDDIEASDADAYVKAGDGSVEFDQAAGGEWVMAEEIWDVTTNNVYTALHGIDDRWVKDPWAPDPTTRFFPYFVLCTSEVDGQRHPQSLTSRSAKLVDEYNRVGSAEAEHRRRCLPATFFHAGMIGPNQLTRITESKVGEWIPVETTQPAENFAGLFYNKPYAPIDPALYDRQRIINELERIWGIQEALSGSINTDKTATEAQIQQSGFNARTGGRRDNLETKLSELANYTAEVAMKHVTREDAQAIAGPDAMWPEYQSPEDLRRMVVVDIRAGSSGKPDTAQERQAWAQQLPLLQAGIVQIGQLRGSSPSDIADALERLLKITAERAGDRLDIDALVPQAGEVPQLPAPSAATPGAPTAPGAQEAAQPAPSSPASSITPQAL
jgi:hypothetical protein